MKSNRQVILTTWTLIICMDWACLKISHSIKWRGGGSINKNLVGGETTKARVELEKPASYT